MDFGAAVTSEQGWAPGELQSRQAQLQDMGGGGHPARCNLHQVQLNGPSGPGQKTRPCVLHDISEQSFRPYKQNPVRRILSETSLCSPPRPFMGQATMPASMQADCIPGLQAAPTAGSSSNPLTTLCSPPSSGYHASFSRGICPIGGSPTDAPSLLTCKTSQFKNAPQQPPLSVSCPPSSVLGPGSSKEKEQGGSGGRKGSVRRSISAMFKSALKPSRVSPSSSSNNLNHISGPGAIPSPPSTSADSLQSCSLTKGASPTHKEQPKNGSFSFKAMLNSLQSPSSSQPHSPAAPSLPDAQLHRAIPVSGRIGAPSMLLVVTKELPPRMSRPSWSLQDYVVLEKVYTGYASSVYKARCKHSGVLVCLKSYTLGNLCELNHFQIFREVKLHSSLSHEHVIKLYGAFQQADQVVLVQEFASKGDLFELLHRTGGRLPERTAVNLVLHPFLSVLNYLHTNGIAHRDIKPENIVYTGDMRLKLADFGLAINMLEERAVTRAGTLEYMAPEVLDCPLKDKPEANKGNRTLHYSYHVDIWAVGVLTYELLVGLPPFADKQRNALEDKIRLAPPRFPSRMSEECRDFITMALEKNPLERPTIMELLTHPWMQMHERSSSIQHLSTLEE